MASSSGLSATLHLFLRIDGADTFRVHRQPDREGRLISRPQVYGALVNPKQ
jgi:hypothetical protein